MKLFYDSQMIKCDAAKGFRLTEKVLSSIFKNEMI